MSGAVRFPGEYEPHLGTLMVWPERPGSWGKDTSGAEKAFADVISNILKVENLYLIVSPGKKEYVREKITSVSKDTDKLFIIEAETDDSWARDNTLIFLKKDNSIRAVDFGFNAWGGKVDGLYSSWEDDNLLGKKLAQLLNIEFYSDKDFILEGGSIHTNGFKTLLTTEACLLSKGRNSNLSKIEIESHLKKMLNIDKVLWIPHGIYNDETNEHVDNMACFLDENTILLATSKDKEDIQYKWSMEAKKILENETTALGNKINVILVNIPNPYLRLTKDEALKIKPIDGAKPRLEGDRLAASYVNFYMGKDFIILPKFNVKEDQEAYDILNNFYKGSKKIYQIESRNILVSGGNIHCITMQI